MSGIPYHMDLHPDRNVYSTSCFILSVLFSEVVRHLWSLHMSGILHHIDLHPSTNVYLTSWFLLSVLFLTGGETSVVPTHVPEPPSRTSTPIAMSTKPAGSFCLCCFCQVVERLWSLNVSRIPNHTDLHPGRNVYLTSWFILSVLFLPGGGTSVVLHMSRIPCYMHLHPDRNVYLTSWFILSVLFLTGSGTSVVPTCVRDILLHAPPPW